MFVDVQQAFSGEPSSLMIRSITTDNRQQFFNLLQEQAAEHTSVVAHRETAMDDLYRSIGHVEGTNAFLVANGLTGKIMTLVTWYPCATMSGEGIYLDDILTTKEEQAKGGGSFALSHLAKIARQRGASYIALECAYHNHRGQAFYDSLGAERFEHRRTWRKLGVLKAAAMQTTCNIRAMRQGDAEVVAALLAQGTDVTVEAGLIKSTHSGSLLANRDFVLAVAENCGRVAGAAIAYRNFSSFRIVNGLHIDRVAMAEPALQLGEAMLDYFAQLQRSRGWEGHLDFTIDNCEAEFWRPILEKHALEPLSYGNDPMVIRRFSGQALENLARRNDRVRSATCIAAKGPL